MNRLSIVLSSLALVVALTAGGAYAATSTVLNGNTIQNHTISLAKLTPKAVKQLKGKRGPRGLDGFDGVDGADGVEADDHGDRCTRRDRRDRRSRRLRPGQDHVRERLPDDDSAPAARHRLAATCPVASKVIAAGWYADMGRRTCRSSTIDDRTWQVLDRRQTAIVSRHRLGVRGLRRRLTGTTRTTQQRPGRFVTVGALRVALRGAPAEAGRVRLGWAGVAYAQAEKPKKDFATRRGCSAGRSRSGCPPRRCGIRGAPCTASGTSRAG